MNYIYTQPPAASPLRGYPLGSKPHTPYTFKYIHVFMKRLRYLYMRDDVDFNHVIHVIVTI